MTNPNINKRVVVEVVKQVGPKDLSASASLNGKSLPIYLKHRTLKPGKRALYLKFSIMTDSYYLAD